MKKKRYSLVLFLLFIAIPVYGDSKTEGNIGILPNNNQKPILNPNNPNEKITVIDNLDDTNKYSFGEEGVLTIDYVSSFQFGQVKAVGKRTTVEANEQGALTHDNQQITVPNFIQITDTRGTNSGWQLSVKQKTQFQTKSQIYPELIGASLQFRNARHISSVDNDIWVNENVHLIPNQEEVLMRAPSGENGGTNILSWENEGVCLVIPGSSPKLAQTYNVTLVWSILDTPN